MTPRLQLDPRLCAGLFVVSLAAAVWAARRAAVLDPLPAPVSASPWGSVVALGGRAVLSPSRLAGALDRDPFHPERRRPGERFRLPGEGTPAATASDSGPAPAVTLIGTAVLPGGRGFAMCRWGAEAPKVVRIGERIGDLTLRRVARGSAVFASAGGREMEVWVPRAGT